MFVYLLVERDDQFQAVFLDEICQVVFVKLVLLRQLKVCSAVIKLEKTLEVIVESQKVIYST